jgi:choline dehydrogenase-like flavoprotein
MELDAVAGGFSEGTVLDTELCIIGAGPAGLTVANTLADRGRDVVVLESGTHHTDPAILALSEGDAEGDAYGGLRETRHRQVGGTSGLWNTPVGESVGAKYAPLDAVDTEERPAIAGSGWPLEYPELESYYRRAQPLCGLGPFAYDAAHWTRPDRAPIAQTGSLVVSRVYQFGTRDALVDPMLRAVQRSSGVRLYTRATAIAIEVDQSRRNARPMSIEKRRSTTSTRAMTARRSSAGSP